MADKLPGARAALVDDAGVTTPQFYRYFQALERLQAGTASAADVAAINTQIAAINAELAALPTSSFPTLQVSAPLTSSGLLQNGFAKLGLTFANSIVVNGVSLQLDGDASAPGNTYLYSTGITGAKGWNALGGMLAGTTDNIAKTVNADGTVTFDLAPVTDSGTGTFKLITRDSFGRLSGTKSGTTSDVPEGTNLYFTAARVLATVLAGLSTATNAAITAADTVLSALGKLQAQITANIATLAGKLTASNNLSDVTSASTSLSNLGGIPITGGTFTGDVNVANSAGTSNLQMFAAASGNQNRFTGYVSGARRWLLQCGDGAAETGSNAGSNYTLFGASDSGSLIGNYMQITRSSGQLTVAGPILPFADNSKSLGNGGLRWSVVYAATGAINTSDARDKTAVSPLSDVEVAAASDLSRAIGTYQWLSSIAEKGSDNARRHAGLTVQSAISIMQAHGLDPMRYGFICYDKWDAVPEVWQDSPEESDEDGNITQAASRVLVQPGQDAGDRYSFRPDELNLFLARGFAARLDALEKTGAA